MTATNLSPTARTAKIALSVFLAPRLAQDEKLPDLNPIVEGLTKKNFEVMIPVIERRVKSAVRGKLAQDQAVDDLPEMMEHVKEASDEDEEVEVPGMEHELGGGHPDDVANDPFPEAHDSDPMLIGKIKELLAGHVAPEVLARIDEMAGANEDAHYDAMEDDECYDRRADDFRRMHGRDETPEEMAEREDREDAEDARRREADDRRPAEDRRREADDRKRRAEDSRRRRHARDRKRAEDARRHLGRDEEPEEAQDRRRRHRAEDRKRALDALRKRAEDRRREADDAKRAEDGSKTADDRKRAEDRRKRAEDRARKAEDAMKRVGAIGRDDPPDFSGKPETGGSMVPMTEDKVRAIAKRAHDEAITQMRGAQAAREYVRPWVGEFRSDMAFDSADEVYRATLKALGVAHGADWPTEALRALVAAQQTPERRGYQSTVMATDAAPAGGGFGSRFKFTQRVGTDG